MSFDFNTFIAALAGTGVFTFLFKIGEKIYDEYSLDKRNKKLSKSQLADEIIKICSEAKSSEFKTEPRSYEHVVFISNKANIYDPAVGKMLNNLATKWILVQQLSDGKYLLGVDDDTLANIIIKIQRQCKKLTMEIIKEIKPWK